MSVDPRISLSIVRAEILECEEDRKTFNWEISEPDEVKQNFTISMKSPIEHPSDKFQGKYILEFQFDDYREIPYLIDFVHPETKVKGGKAAYPASSKGPAGSFFNQKGDQGCICHPCSRKAYPQYLGIHGDWTTMSGWEKKAGSISTLRGILRAVNARITDPNLYNGRMNA